MGVNDKIKIMESRFIKKDIPPFKVGDTLEVHVKVVEEGKARIQVFEGIVIAKKGSGIRGTFTIRKVSFGEGVERIFPIHAPSIAKIIVTKKGKVKKSKLYYLRERTGKAARVKEKTGKYSPLAEQSGLAETAEPPGSDAEVREEGKKEGI